MKKIVIVETKKGFDVHEILPPHGEAPAVRDTSKAKDAFSVVEIIASILGVKIMPGKEPKKKTK